MKLSTQQQSVIDYIAGAMVMNSCYVASPILHRTLRAVESRKLIEFVEWRGGYRYELTPKGQNHVVRAYWSGIGYVVAAEELSVIKMTSGNEKRYPQVIDLDNRVKTWVGVGWVDDGEPTIYQRNMLPHKIA